ncbi:MAG: ChaN family lipoprotein [Bacteroidales bacterium]|nr:ChaN family lipoprotein [Bacteroidales bacterium]
MKKFKLISIVLVALILMSMKGDNPAYMLFDANGKKMNYKNLVKDAAAADIVFFGEQHNSPIAHWLQLELTKDLFEQKQENLVLGAEMFETDNQLLMDEYLTGAIAVKNFEAEAKLWKNYKTDYKPLVDFAKDHQLEFIATNIPRRYASLVHKKGFEALDSLSADAKDLIAPLPVKYDPELEGYKSMLEEMNDGMGGGHVTPNLPKAQAIKDATMAHFILKNWEQGNVFIHYNGAYHSNDYEGIVWYLKQKNPDLKILTITTIDQDTINDLNDEFKNLADYILCIPANMTKTY